MKKKYVWLFLLAAVVIVGLVLTLVALNQPKGTPVETAVVGHEDLQAKVAANGKVQAQKKVEISATVMGQVTKIAVKEGDRVTKGQFLLQLDAVNPRSYAKSFEAGMKALTNELQSAKANLELAKSDMARAEENWRAKIISEADHQRAKTALATAEAAVAATQKRVDQAVAQLEGAQDSLAKTTVNAPIDGIVTAKRIEEGEVAVIGIQNSPGTVLLTISDMSVVEAELEVDETSIPSVKLGQDALVRIDAFPNKSFNATVTEVGSSPLLKLTGEQAIRFKVKVQIKNPPEGIKPGLSCQAEILTGFRPKAVAVPIQALIIREIERKPGETPKPGEIREEEGVYLVENNKAVFKKLKTGLMGELSIEVLEGLKGGETLVSGPFKTLRSLKDGELIQVKPQDKDASKSAEQGKS